MKQHSDEANCAWSDYRKDYGVSNHEPIRSREHKAFHAGWDAAKADIERTHYLVKLADLPEVTEGHEQGSHYVEGESVVFTSAENARMWTRRDIAVLRHLQSRESEVAARQARRDEVARKYTPLGYEAQSFENKAFIDDLIAAEDARTAAEAEVARLKGERG